eukprot:2788303-Pleurochrysis_carterae.AAC.2
MSCSYASVYSSPLRLEPRVRVLALARLRAMPVLHAHRAAGQGAGGVSLPFAIRALVFGHLALLIPPRAVGPNIAVVLRCVAAPWHPCINEPFFDAVCRLRSA